MNAHSNASQAREQYADELMRRYLELRRWAVENWPNPEQPLQAADFIATDRELQLLLGARARLNVDKYAQQRPANAQYEDVTPMPWP
ncbi:hypothetical protein [Herbaspirillum lusitanum]|uniref:hypothetical protein n=1 Tax=Herbaspirillum lusitanum TaxID=213312 RepID=UPI0002E852B0|nr:hypothetical protein [Herbaspirillum lusitanum]